MNKIGIRRLQKLEAHLRKGELFHKKFNMNVWNDADGPVCGTNGCAIGECVGLFPKYWKWDRLGLPHLNGLRYQYVSNSIETFFDVDASESYHLFVPSGQHIKKYGGKRLSSKATRIQVANNIRDFLKIKMEESK